MFRKNVMIQYKLFSKNLQNLKDRVLLTAKDDVSSRHYEELISKVTPSQYSTFIQSLRSNYQQLLKNGKGTLENHSKKTVVYCSVANGKSPDSKMEREQNTTLQLCNAQLDELRRQLNQINKTNSIRPHRTYENPRNRLAMYSAAGGIAVASEESVKAAQSAEATTLIIEPIPEPPPIPEPEAIAETISQVNALGEPTLASLGLGGWTPVGIIQNCLEYLHVALDMPWWGAIAIGTVIVRLLMFPLVVIAQRNAAKMNNYLPQLQAIQLKMTEARQCGNQIDAARYSQEMMIFMKEKNLNPLKNMIVPLAQMPLFISFFVGLRKMANLPVDSLREGGMLWFTDLTVPDQYFALPIITSLTLWTTIELGTDSARLSSQNLQTMKYILRALPVVILPFTVNFPGAILCYWVSSNFISLAQVGFLRIPSVRDYFKIEPLIKHNPQNLPMKSKGFVGGIKDSWTNVKITRELEERRKFDELQFQRAGRGPVVKTYKYDPTKQVNNPAAINAKKR